MNLKHGKSTRGLHKKNECAHLIIAQPTTRVYVSLQNHCKLQRVATPNSMLTDDQHKDIVNYNGFTRPCAKPWVCTMTLKHYTSPRGPLKHNECTHLMITEPSTCLYGTDQTLCKLQWVWSSNILSTDYLYTNTVNYTGVIRTRSNTCVYLDFEAPQECQRTLGRRCSLIYIYIYICYGEVSWCCIFGLAQPSTRPSHHPN